MADETTKKGKTGKFVPRGQTAGDYGNDPATPGRKQPARELRP